MNNSLDDSKPIFQQIKEQIEDMIINHSILEGERVPSTNEFASYYKINPATAAKGINQLVDEGVLYKRRGVGMFVSDQAKHILFQKRKASFIENYVVPLKTEAKKLNISEEELQELIKGGDER
ncbi:GntR family transcriptional regulator [Aquibacillus koreensis]|uniref:GntR family transcriptional regulator n=1 Tax=Aquibacillus koreensis TaxID=279446 RepID=A0A9X3WQX5_9BACI|nr:GntR family transcriptional regulator [Aquibacillus koreensis]MCT2534407.1 GntR family transcriptional regulator [Aquibacillus koreensis]MDC3421714.1 GntR family transcriptional regulator [Aquibacillus koreensis]